MSSSAITGPILSDVRRSPSGSAAAPSWSFADATGTGVYLASTDVLALSTAGVQRVVVDAAGNVGVGVTPSAWISNAKAIQIGAFLSAWTGSNGSANLSFGAYEGSINSYRYLTTGDAPTLYQQLTGAHRWYTAPSGTAGDAVTFTERMTLDSSGNVGIGTASPSSAHALDIRRSTGQVAISLGASGATAGVDNFELQHGASKEAYIWNRANSYISFGTNNTERMRIDANGALTVGSAGTSITHTIQAPSNPAGTPAVFIRKQNVAINSSGNSYLEFYGASGGYDGYLGITGTTLQVVDSSDARKKENIRPANYGLKEIQALKPAVFDWKEEFGGEKNVKGFIAQEVKEVLPECVTIKDESEHGGLADSHFLGTATIIPVLVAAIQELKAELDEAKAKIAALEAK